MRCFDFFFSNRETFTLASPVALQVTDGLTPKYVVLQRRPKWQWNHRAFKMLGHVEILFMQLVFEGNVPLSGPEDRGVKFMGNID